MSENLREDELVERACAAVRQEAEGLSPATADAVLDRLRQRLGVAPELPGQVLGCAQLQRLLPAFLAGALSPQREMLVADHTRSCLACRRALKALQGAPPTEAVTGATTRRLPRWALAAAAAVVVLLGAQLLVLRQVWFGGGMLRVVQGTVVGLGGQQAQAFGAGAEVPYGQQVVTPRGQSAMVRLADGSLVELRERTRFAVLRRRGGTDLHLEGGNVIIEAAKQAPGSHLWVTTGDCEVAVVGTVFAVEAGTRGSRVSVYEGEVHVHQAGRDEKILHPGSQTATSPRVRPVSLQEEVSWSSRRDQHLALLVGVALLQQEMAALPPPVKRFSSPFLDRLPADTVLYAAFPNLAGNLAQGLQRLQDRLAQDPSLAAALGAGGDLPRLGTFLDHLVALGGDLGDELVGAGWLDAAGHLVGPVALAPVADPAGLRARLQTELPQLERDLTGSAGTEEGSRHLQLVADPMHATGGGLLLWISDADGALVVACNPRALADMAAALGDRGQPFREQPFHATVSERYAAGVEGLLAVDLAAVVARQQASGHDGLARLGLDGVKTLLLEQWTAGDQARREAVLSFAAARHGIASWLAAPAPMGALSFFSPDSTVVAAFVVKQPVLLIEDALASLTPEERQSFETEHAKFVAAHGWDPITDLAQPLGGEVAVGIDGPVVPQPAWKAVIEVYDPAGLQVGIARLIADLDTQLRQHGQGAIALLSEGDGWVVRRTKGDGTIVDGHYRYQDGYFVASATAGLVDKALRSRASGMGLLQSPRLRALLPPDRQLNLSALWYQDLDSVLAPLAGAVQGMQGGNLPPALQRLAGQLGTGTGPTAVFAYGEEDRIRISSSGPRDPLGLAGLLLSRGGLGPLAAAGRDGG